MVFATKRGYLRKLIKYEESLGVDVHQKDYFDNLYRKTTASYRAKVQAASDGEHIGRHQGSQSHVADRQANVDRENRENDSRRKGKSEMRIGDERQEKTSGILKERDGQGNSHRNDPKTKSVSEVDVHHRRRDPRQLTLIRKDSTEGGSSGKGREVTPSVTPATESAAPRPSRTTARTSNAMWIRPRSKTPHSSKGRRKVMDPVQLYQYYQHEWEKFKTNLPGETNRSELRWQIRYKLLGE